MWTLNRQSVNMLTRFVPARVMVHWRTLFNAVMFNTIFEPIVYIMWDPQRLTTLWAFMACYRDTFTLLFTLLESVEQFSFILTAILPSINNFLLFSP
jgi:hypothetical protein